GSPALGGRVGFVVGDLLTLELGHGRVVGAAEPSPAPPVPPEPRNSVPSPHARGSNGDGGTAPLSTWNADELLAGRNLFAVERIGHAILSNTRKARGLAPIPEPPLLAAA